LRVRHRILATGANRGTTHPLRRDPWAAAPGARFRRRPRHPGWLAPAQRARQDPPTRLPLLQRQVEPVAVLHDQRRADRRGGVVRLLGSAREVLPTLMAGTLGLTIELAR